MHINKKIVVVDHTLRDGEQQAFINFNQKQKFQLATAIKKIGVDYIDIMPIANSTEYDTTVKLLDFPLLVSTPLNEISINLAMRLKKDIILFQAVSDELLNIRKKTRVENIKEFKSQIIRIRKNIGKKIKIYVAGEDTSRANYKYVMSFLKEIEDLIDGFLICDSVGYLIPEKTKELVLLLKNKFRFKVGIHAHNNLGFADQNTITAVLYGADIISGTFTGIGEGTGNANLGNVLKTLRNYYSIGLKKINYGAIPKVEKMVFKFAKRHPAKPFSKESFYVESGIHVHALLKSPTAYSLLDPASIGHQHKVFFSKKSGISNFKWYLGDKYDDETYGEWRDKIKKLSIKRNRSYSFREIKKYLKHKNS